MTLITNRKHALIKFCRMVLQKDEDYLIHDHDVNFVRNIIQNKIDIGISPAELRTFYNMSYSDFGMFLKKGLQIKLKSVKDSVNNYFHKTGRSDTDEKSLYKKSCLFTFDPYQYPNIKGFDLMLKHGFFNVKTNKNGMCRDHIISIQFGWNNQIDPNIISHPANCQYLSNQDNIKKNSDSWMELDQLKLLISNWNDNTIQYTINHPRKTPKSKEHLDKLRLASSKYFNITNGVINKKLMKSEEIPEGFRRGITQKKR